MSNDILKTVGLFMWYDKKLALNNLDLSINRGDIYGLIGPNGAGKTTTFKIAATILRPTVGKVLIGGMDISDKDKIRSIRRKIGYMPDSFGVYEDMTVEEYLSFFAAAYDIVNPRRQQLVKDVLALVDLDVKKDALIESLSRGMQQRLGIARVLIHDPELLILDEPASGLDPRARIEIRGLLLELKKMGKTILISSHILADLGEICTRVGIIEKGKLLVDGTLQDVLRMVKPSPFINLRVAENPELAVAELKKLPFIVDGRIQNEVIAVEVQSGFNDVWKISAALVEKGFKLNQIQQESESLERAFIELTEGTVS